MKLTRGGEYALRAILYLAQEREAKVHMVSAVAKAQEIPPRFLAKIFQILAKAGLVASHRGVKGGFSLTRPAEEITLRNVIEAIEGPISLNSATAAPLNQVWEEAQDQMLQALSRVTFAELASAHRPPSALAMTHPLRPLPQTAAS